MNEEVKVEDNPGKKKKKRHFIVWVLLIAFALMLLGQLLGEMMCAPFNRLFPDMPGRWAFSLMYLSFIGIVLLVLIYVALADKELKPIFRSARRGGIRGNTLRNFGLGVLIGFLMNGACILVAWLHGDLHFSVGRFI